MSTRSGQAYGTTEETKLTKKIVLVAAGVIMLSTWFYPVVFGQVHERSSSKGGPLARSLSEKNRQLATTFHLALSRQDYVTAERTLQEWGGLPGVFGKNSGYWICMVQLRNQQQRFSEASDAYKKLYSFQSTLQDSPGFLSDWALASSKAGRKQEVRAIYELVAATPTFQQDATLNRIPLSRLASDPQAVEAISELLKGRAWINATRYDLAEKSLKAAVALRPDLLAGQLLLAQALRQQNKTEEAQTVLSGIAPQARGPARIQVEAEQKLLDAQKRSRSR